MNYIQLVRFYLLLKMFGSKSHTLIFLAPFLITFKYYAWASDERTKQRVSYQKNERNTE